MTRQRANPPDRLVLWDIDGTLVDPGRFGWGLICATYRELFGAEVTAAVPRAGRTDRAICADVLRLHDRSPEHLDAFCTAVAARAAPERTAHSSFDGHLLPGARRALRTLAGQPTVVQSVLTGNLAAIGTAKLHAVELADSMDLAVAAFGDHHEDRADLVDVARRAFTRRYQVAADRFRTVLVGDTPLDVAAARSAGADVVAVATGHYSPAELTAAGAALVLPSLVDADSVVAAVLTAAPAGPAG
ncbi:HAD family hydrolase [Micromonospora auratinigra]|uniref:Phosphoglycolate phosphatase, HAD superfamily n=1 Tax=Micromonospora auratinigra TaxID=261654 RepID=A0A1A8Z950_9ACTN|nr:HAD hydrolase-like protein [Micromonospora auratinigra]SBT40484.1 Phosphoglycolate phosphatase, HAD superfamily [Micromonospora auratinigra]